MGMHKIENFRAILAANRPTDKYGARIICLHANESWPDLEEDLDIIGTWFPVGTGVYCLEGIVVFNGGDFGAEGLDLDINFMCELRAATVEDLKGHLTE